MLLLSLAGTYIAKFDFYGKYIWSDAEGYYMYLPAVMLYGNFEEIPVRTPYQFPVYPGTKKVLTKYTYGIALLEAPFYLGAYAAYIVSGKTPKLYDGTYYSIAILIAACFYGTLGLFLLYMALKYHLKKSRVPLVIVGVVLLGTNLLFYIVQAPGMPHVYSFFLFSWIVYLTPKLYQNAGVGTFIGLGALIGLTTLIRPVNGLVVLFPFLYGVQSLGGLRERIAFFRHKFFSRLLPALVMALLVWLPQFYYWHYLSGSWLFYSYGDEGFINWSSPKILQVLFSVKNGLFVYNPVLLLAVIALFFMLRKNALNSWAVLGIFLISIYVYSSWWCWWFGGAYGQRNYVDQLPLLALPLAFAIDRIWSSKRQLAKVFLLAFLLITVFYNLRCTFLYHWTWSDYDWTARKYREEVFLKVFFLN